MSHVDELGEATATLPPRDVASPSVTGTELRILPFEDADPVRQFATITFLRGGLIAIAVTLVGGMLGALYSVPSLAPTFQSLGLDLRQLRPVHTTFASAWIFLGGMAVVHRYLMDHGGYATNGDRWRLRVQVICWAAAGLGILVTLLMGVGSGREYVGFHPAFSVLILAGWLCYAWNFFRIVGPGFWNRPLYVTMWGVGTVFFVYTFLEQHAYLLPELWGDPVHDLRVQWKATGTLVGAFNLFVYGSVIYIGERISGDAEYGHSRTAYALFAVGLLNSFTNFAHHTYHLPQRDLVKWISFVVSMMEIIILVRAVSDLVKLVRTREDRPFCATRGSFAAAKYWSVAIVGSAVLISIPPLNAIIHGTYAVTGHAMGATIGIDTMILLGAVIWIVGEYLRAREGEDASSPLHCARMRWSVIGLNVGVALLVGWLHLAGVVTGVTRMRLAPSEVYVPPAWPGASSGIMFAATGALAFVFFSLVLATLIPLSFRSFRTADSA
jgi:nitric oxide reductase subunit B